ncbi:hypothetical protein C8J57DRAFT_1524355 [Mycena rebaudengoi]|nr:hypothetical protein C8J57DRAFT_1524355 [Mycena rebaudengoi]
MQMQFTGLVTIVILTMVVSVHPLVVNLSPAIRQTGTCPPGNDGCNPGRDNGVTEAKYDPQNTGTYDGPIERCNVVTDGCPNLD